MAALTSTSLGACGSRQTASRSAAGYMPPPQAPGTVSWRPQTAGLDAVIDISSNVTVTDFRAVRRSNILAVIHKTTEGGDWVDPAYAQRRADAESAGLLWGAYHFGTRQYSGVRQATAFLKAAQPGPSTLIALDFEPNDGNPNNTMGTHQAEEFVRTVQQSTGRLPVLYTHVKWANGERFGRRGLRLPEPVGPTSILAHCDLWLADHRDPPEVPYAWGSKGWRLWQYAADESAADAAYGSTPRAIQGVTHCDRNLFAGDVNELHRYWRSSGSGRPGGRTGV